MAEIEKPDYVANRIEAITARMLDSYVNIKVSRFTESVRQGRRYIGFTSDDGRTIAIQIDVQDITDKEWQD